jgi:hypothetical protein
MVCASSLLLLDSARAQNSAITWVPLSQLQASSLYSKGPTTPLDLRPLAAETSDTVARQIRPTHWKEGGVVGAVLLGAFGIWFGNELCQKTEAGQDNGCTAKAVAGGLIGGGGLGFLIGALIGGQFPKHPPGQAETN